ncbi:MAG: transcription-repair coupling factor [Alteromonadaceae bacterium]|nr:MAG: transcription-repair coupling factor [Alteromonadaceae bacterium]
MSSPISPPPCGKPGDKQHWGNLLGSSLGLAVASRACAHSGCTLLIVQNMTVAARLQSDIESYIDGQENAPEVVLFSDWETLPYDTFSPHQDIISDRMRCLYQLAKAERSLVIVSAQTLAQRLVPQSYILSKSLVIKNGERLDRERFRQQLVFAGYSHVDTVHQHGEFALRGSLIDVFPMGSDSSYRVELFDDEIESLRKFDPETQRTICQVNDIELLPGQECPLDEESCQRFRHNWHEKFDVQHKRCPVYQDVNSGLSPSGVEYFLPLFFESTATLLDYLPENTQILVNDGFEDAYEEFWREATHRYEERCVDPERPILPPHEIFLPVNELFGQLKQFPRITLHTNALEAKLGTINFDVTPPPLVEIDSRANNPLHNVEQLLYNTEKRVIFCAESNGRREILKEHLRKIDVEPDDIDNIHTFLNSSSPIAITIADLDHGISSADPAVLIIAESQLFGTQIRQTRRRKTSNEEHDNIVKNLTELKLEAPVVHIDHGVGRYKGLQTIEHDGQAEEFLVLLYANEAKLYVPVANLHLISRYSGSGEDHAPLHRLGNELWQKAKRKAVERIRDVAADLLDIYAKRKAKIGFAYTKPKQDYEIFSAGFPFEETPDQQAAIIAVVDDMLSPQPMDRLVCGDVGFGKTEVAMRAAFIAVQNGKQVAIMVPTTLLAQQHYENFKDRFADWPVNIEVLSRFRSTKESNDVIKRLEAGKVDLIVGTHKLIQGSIKYANLGLMIIDEEHRFGVRQKEAMKALRTDIDILTMTATPIPRTLNMSMNGIRDLSIIATPPAKRLSVKTFVRESDQNIIKEAILREIMRGGQVYYLHNEVKDIEKIAANLEVLVPEARVRIGHGQMRERDLESVMSDFYHKRFNILVCTTIIETGIDVPNANTIIIDRADTFGLAQLHQLRGRVGRSHHQAYAYLMAPNKRNITADAHKRLEAISEAQELGAGFMLASHDMEIRGAGELLGDEQSGQIQTIGFSLYMDMLDRAVKAIQSGREIDLEKPYATTVDMNLRIPALIPADYLPDIHTRLTLYKRIASTTNESQLEALQIEMIDRFGLLPSATKNLFLQSKLRFEAESLGVSKIDAGASQGRIEFSEDTKVEPLNIVKLVQNQPQHYRLEGANHLKFTFDMQSSDKRLQAVHTLFKHLKKAS